MVGAAMGESDKLLLQHISAGLVLTFIVLPPITRSIFRAADCIEVAGVSYLRIDTLVSCDSNSFRQFQIGNVLFMAVYLSIPMFWAVLLWSNRNDIFSKRGDANPILKSLQFLMEPYRSQCYFWESVDM